MVDDAVVRPFAEVMSVEAWCEVCGELYIAPVVWFDAGHDPRCRDPLRHCHLVDPMAVCPDCKSGIKQTSKMISKEASGLVWAAVHGNLLLALRHPENRGSSRKLVVDFVKALEVLLEQEGVLTPNQLRKTRRLEVEAGSDEFGILTDQDEEET